MRKAALFYNPRSGRRIKHRISDVNVVLEVLRAAGVEIEASATTSSAGTTAQALRAIAAGCDTVLACGGDGTIHDVLQALAGTPIALGIIPLGTANTLAHDLRIPLAPASAARAALGAQPKRLAAGLVTFRDFSGNAASRYFTVAAGIGIDAHLFYKLNMLVKGRLGMLAYYLKATRLWLTHDLQTFKASLNNPAENGKDHIPTLSENIEWHEVSQLLAVRISEFGGVLRELAPGASLQNSHHRVVLFKTQNRLLYLGYILRGLLGRRWPVPGIELADAKTVSCIGHFEAGSNSRIFVEADGELLGTLPAEISIVPDAFTLLIPKS